MALAPAAARREPLAPRPALRAGIRSARSFCSGSLAVRFGLGLDAPWYLAALVAVGYVPPVAVLGAVAWLAAAGQVGALAFGRYAPYPTRGARRRVGVLALARRLHMPRV